MLLSLLLVAGAMAATPTLVAHWLGGQGSSPTSPTSANYHMTQLVVYPSKAHVLPPCGYLLFYFIYY